MSFRDLPAVSLKVDSRRTDLRVYEARGFLSRARGLLGRCRLQAHEALWLRPCSSVHTLGMRYCIDVVFLDRQQRVLIVKPHLKPLRLAGSRRACSTVELQAGVAAIIGIVAGSQLERVP